MLISLPLVLLSFVVQFFVSKKQKKSLKGEFMFSSTKESSSIRSSLVGIYHLSFTRTVIFQCYEPQLLSMLSRAEASFLFILSLNVPWAFQTCRDPLHLTNAFLSWCLMSLIDRWICRTWDIISYETVGHFSRPYGHERHSLERYKIVLMITLSSYRLTMNIIDA